MSENYTRKGKVMINNETFKSHNAAKRKSRKLQAQGHKVRKG